MNFFGKLHAWIATPLTTPLSPGGVFAVVGIVFVAALAWGFILRHVTAGVEGALS